MRFASGTIRTGNLGDPTEYGVFFESLFSQLDGYYPAKNDLTGFSCYFGAGNVEFTFTAEYTGEIIYNGEGTQQEVYVKCSIEAWYSQQTFILPIKKQKGNAFYNIAFNKAGLYFNGQTFIFGTSFMGANGYDPTRDFYNYAAEVKKDLVNDVFKINILDGAGATTMSAKKYAANHPANDYYDLNFVSDLWLDLYDSAGSWYDAMQISKEDIQFYHTIISPEASLFKDNGNLSDINSPDMDMIYFSASQVNGNSLNFMITKLVEDLPNEM